MDRLCERASTTDISHRSRSSGLGTRATPAVRTDDSECCEVSRGPRRRCGATAEHDRAVGAKRRRVAQRRRQGVGQVEGQQQQIDRVAGRTRFGQLDQAVGPDVVVEALNAQVAKLAGDGVRQEPDGERPLPADGRGGLVLPDVHAPASPGHGAGQAFGEPERVLGVRFDRDSGRCRSLVRAARSRPFRARARRSPPQARSAPARIRHVPCSSSPASASAQARSSGETSFTQLPKSFLLTDASPPVERGAFHRDSVSRAAFRGQVAYRSRSTRCNVRRRSRHHTWRRPLDARPNRRGASDTVARPSRPTA